MQELTLHDLGDRLLKTVQVQQRAEREAALARLDQSRIILVLRLPEHHGNNYKSIEDAINFVRDLYTRVQLLNLHPTAPAERSLQQRRRVSSNLVARVLLTGFDTAKKTLQLDNVGHVNAALFALGMLALLHLPQMT